MEVYLREQPRHHSTSTERENTNPHHIDTTHLPVPTRGQPQKSGGHNPHTTHPPKEHAQRMQDIPAQGRDCQGNTQSKEHNMQQDISNRPVPKVWDKDILSHQKCSPKNPPRAGTTISTTSHAPPANELCTNRSHPTATINWQRNPSRH